MAYSRILVVYYSRTGKTRMVSKLISKRLGCRCEELVDTKDRKGIAGCIKAIRDATKKRETLIKPIKREPSMYELVIIGTPIWASHITPAVRTYIHENKERIKNIAFFCTKGGSGKSHIHSDIKEILKEKPVASLSISGKDFKEGRYIKKVEEFINKLK